MYIDTHCHLNFPEFNDDRGNVITNAKKAGVKKFIIPGASLATSKTAMSLVQKHPDCMYAAIGFHPYECNDHPDVKQLELLLNQNNITYHMSHVTYNQIVAIGECGLDYHLYKGFPAEGKKTEQKQLFEEQLLLALKYNLAVIIHCRDGTSYVPAASDRGAYEDIFDVLDGLPDMPKGVFHCFAGGLADYREVEKRGFFVGFDGNVTYSKQLTLIIPQIPLNKIILETDAPYLTPAPYRGQRNEPKYLLLTAKKIAELKNCSLTEVETQTTDNAKMIFNI